MNAVKTVIAALVITTFASMLPVAASDTAPVLRLSDNGIALPVGAKDPKTPAASVEAQPAKKIRVVLASPYGN